MFVLKSCIIDKNFNYSWHFKVVYYFLMTEIRHLTELWYVCLKASNRTPKDAEFLILTSSTSSKMLPIILAFSIFFWEDWVYKTQSKDWVLRAVERLVESAWLQHCLIHPLISRCENLKLLFKKSFNGVLLSCMI